MRPRGRQQGQGVLQIQEPTTLATTTEGSDRFSIELVRGQPVNDLIN